MRILFLGALVMFYSGVQAQQLTSFSGKVSDTHDLPVAGATIYLLNTNRGVATDSKGNFNINNIPAGKYTVQISAIGYATLNLDVILPGSGTTEILLEDESQQLDAVLVSAQKREESLHDIPFSISALSSRQVQQFRLWNTRELTAIVPNLYSANSGDERNVTSIRGIATTSYDQAVATYIDGVNQFNLDTYIPQLFDVERIEVLRGPQGTLYGRNAMGGVINIITKQPTNKTSGFAEVSLGNFNQQRYIAGLRTPIVANKLYAGASIMYNSRDGFYKNEFTNSSYDKQNSITGNYYLKYIINEKWTLGLNAKHNENRNNGPFPLSFPTGSFEDFLKEGHVLTQNATSKMIDNTFNGSFTANYAGRAFNFSSQTAYQSNHRYYTLPLDGDFSPIDGITVINNYGEDWNKVTAWTQEFKISSPAMNSSSLKWTAGAYLFTQHNPVKQATHFGMDAGMMGAPDTDFSLITSSTGRNSGGAVFGQLVYAINDKIDIIGGLRFDYEKKKFNVLGEYQKSSNPPMVTRPDTSATTSFNAISPKLGIMYKLAASSNLFATYSRGYRTGGLTQLSATDPSQPPLYPYKPEYSNNLEIGIKNNFFDNRLRLNMAFFLTQVTDVQVPTLILPDAITVTRNAGKLNSKGAELELATTPVKGLEIEYNFGYTDATYKTLKLSQNGASVDLAGKKQVFTPDITSMLAAQYSFNLNTRKQLKLVLRGEWMHLGEQYFDLSNNISQDAYSLLNVRVGISARFGELMFWGRNLADTRYIAYAYDFGAIHIGNPATYGVTLRARF
ncbi:MAG TPA: TonB-dependent receptor [Chitinophagaceae bacterium]|nr:TonB-dependent receptor [Chitinophagaceae bacterium]